MVKAVDKGAVIESVALLAKSGGKSGDYRGASRPRRENRIARPDARARAKPATLMGEVAAPRPTRRHRCAAARSLPRLHDLAPAARDAVGEAGGRAGVARSIRFLTGTFARRCRASRRKACARGAKVRVEDMFRDDFRRRRGRTHRRRVHASGGAKPWRWKTRGGRVLADDARAQRDQPPAPVSAMDGYAVRAADVVTAARRCA